MYVHESQNACMCLSKSVYIYIYICKQKHMYVKQEYKNVI